MLETNHVVLYALILFSKTYKPHVISFNSSKDIRFPLHLQATSEEYQEIEYNYDV